MGRLKPPEGDVDQGCDLVGMSTQHDLADPWGPGPWQPRTNPWGHFSHHVYPPVMTNSLL